MHSSAAGHVDAGDSYETAAHKELQEELGIDNAVLEFIGKFRQTGLDHEICAVYLAHHDGPYSNWQEEAEGISFFTVEELEKLVNGQPHVFTPTFKEAFRLLVQRK